MTPAIGIGFLSLTGILFIAYVLFLVEQHKIQNELARHYKEGEDDRGGERDRLHPVIEVWIYRQCGFMSTMQSFCIHCSAPRPKETTFLKIGLKEYVEQPAHRQSPVFGETQIHTLVPREAEQRRAHAH